MNDLILEGPFVIPSPNGKFRVKLQVGDDGSLLATLFERDPNDPNKWNRPTPSGISESKILLRTWRDASGKIQRVE